MRGSYKTIPATDLVTKVGNQEIGVDTSELMLVDVEGVTFPVRLVIEWVGANLDDVDKRQIVMTVWFGDKMVDLCMDPDTKIRIWDKS